jgi:hypothetical protein
MRPGDGPAALGPQYHLLEDEGVMVAGGPMLREFGTERWLGDAMFIFKAQSEPFRFWWRL